MKNQILLIFIFLLANISFSQEYNIKGSVRDFDNDELLEAATIFAQKLVDSTLISYTISDGEGNFNLKINTTESRIRFLVSFNGYQTFEKYIDLNLNQTILGTIKLKPFIFELDEMEIIGEVPPILIKKDTLEFNAASFKLNLESTLEDLLRVLPGVDLEDNGDIFINGNRVSGIKVNGKSFFSSDTKIALKNLPVEIIDKLQVVDKKSQLQEFTGTGSNSDVKEINVTIKEDKNKGTFGSLLAGIGNDSEYQISGILNYFNKDERLTVLGGSNNIDNPGFTYDDLSELSSNARNLSWRGNLKGVSSSDDVGLNYSKDLSDKTEFIGEYFYSNVDVINTDQINRQYFLPDNSYINSSRSDQSFVDSSHRFDMNFKILLDSLTQLSIIPKISLTNQKNVESTIGTSQSLDGNLINSSKNLYNIENENRNFSSDINLVRKFRKQGEFISLKLGTNLTNFKELNNLENTIEIINSPESNLFITQQIEQDNESTNLSSEFGIRKHLSKDFFFFPMVQYSTQKMKSNRNIFDNEVGSNLTIIDDLSSDYTVDFSYLTPSLGFEYNRERIDFSIKSGVYISSLESLEENRLNYFRHNLRDLFFESMISYKLSNREKLSLNIGTDIKIPNINYFLPVANEVDLSNIYLGNLALKRIYSQNYSLNYNNYNSKSKVGFFAFGQITFFKDDISIIRNTNDQLVRTISYDNTDGNIDANIRISVSKTKNIENHRLRYHLGFNSRLYRRNNMTNGINYGVDRWSIYPTFRFNYSTGDVFSLETSYSPRIVFTSYRPRVFENSQIQSHEINLNTSLNLPKKLVFESDFFFNLRPDIGDDFRRTNIFWNVSLGYKILNDKGLLKLRYFDLLNENVNNYRYTGEDYIQDSSSSVLNSYLMLSLSYKVSKSNN